MLCAELELLEAQLDDLITALEQPDLTPVERQRLEREYHELAQLMDEHRASGHNGSGCFEE